MDGDTGAHLRHIAKQGIHILLVLESTLLFGAVVILHHQIGDGTEYAVAAEAAAAHGHPLEHPLHGVQRDIIITVDKICADIQRLFPDAAGAEGLAGRLVRLYNILCDGGGAELYRGKCHRGTSVLKN